jgi:hypothetical protein
MFPAAGRRILSVIGSLPSVVHPWLVLKVWQCERKVCVGKWEAAMVTGILAAIGGLVALFVLLDLTGLLPVRAGKRPMPGWRRNALFISAFASAAIPDISRGGEPRRGSPVRRRERLHLGQAGTGNPGTASSAVWAADSPFF